MDGGLFEDPAEVDEDVEAFLHGGGRRHHPAAAAAAATVAQLHLGHAWRHARHALFVFGHEQLLENRKLVRGILDKLVHQHVVVLRLEALEARLEVHRGEVLARVRVEAAVDQARDVILPLVPNVRERRVVVDERRAGETDAVEVEDHVDGVHGPRLVPDFHPPQNDFVEEPGEAVLHFRKLLHEGGEPVVPVDEVVVVQVPHVLLEVLEADELALL